MNTTTVTWRQTVAAAVAVVVALVGVVVLFSSDGLPAVNAASSGRRAGSCTARPATWSSSTATALGPWPGSTRPAAASRSAWPRVAPLAYLVNDTTAEVKPIETADLKIGAPVGLAVLGDGQAVSAVGTDGPDRGEPRGRSGVRAPARRRAAELRCRRHVAAGDRARRRRVDDRRLGAPPDELVDVVGPSTWASAPVPRCRSSAASRSSSTGRIGVPASVTGRGSASTPTADPSEFVGQVSGPAGPCGWIGANDDLWCVGTDGITERATIAGLARRRRLARHRRRRRCRRPPHAGVDRAHRLAGPTSARRQADDGRPGRRPRRDRDGRPRLGRRGGGRLGVGDQPVGDQRHRQERRPTCSWSARTARRS